MILVLAGLERYPFDRLFAWIDEGIGAGKIPPDVLGQTGASRYRPRHFPVEACFSLPRLRELVARADVLVCHAGVGSVILGLEAGKVPVIVPRRAGRKEHVDDHQVAFALRMEKAGRLIVARSAEDLYEKIRAVSAGEVLPGRGPDRSASRSLAGGLEEIISGIGRRKSDRRAGP